MRHEKEELLIGSHGCTIATEEGRGGFLLVQPTDSHDREELDKEIAYIEQNVDAPFTLAAVHVERWFEELAPWPAPPVFGKMPFGDGAAETLRYITDELCPYLSARYGGKSEFGDKKGTSWRVILGGYSLAGLFALWAGCRSAFYGIAAASPSVWYEGWVRYAQAHACLSPRVYLSLGDRETHTKTKVMATVGDRLEEERDLLLGQGVDVKLEMNPGNHFQDNGIRMGKGFADIMNRK